jgi:hypothetical protein
MEAKWGHEVGQPLTRWTWLFMLVSCPWAVSKSIAYQSLHPSVGVVMRRAGNLGAAQICLTDLTAGTPAACRTIDLSPATGTAVRKLVYEEHGLDPSHSYRVAVKDTAGRIELDALALLQ